MMSAQLYAPNPPHQARSEPTGSLTDWTAAAAALVTSLSAAVVIASILVLLTMI